MLPIRILSALTLFGLVLIFLWLDATQLLNAPAGAWLIPVFIFFIGGTAWECGKLLQTRWSVIPSHIAIAIVGNMLLSCLPIFYEMMTGRNYPRTCPIGLLGWPLIGILLALGWFGIGALRRLQPGDHHLVEIWAISTWAVVYIAGASSFVVPIRLYGGDVFGFFAFVGLIATIKFCDIGAFFVGRMLGRTKLCPIISPKKTVEGAIGGVLSSVCIAEIWFHGVVPVWDPEGSFTRATWFGPGLLGMCLGATGILGDLLESTIKRCLNVKDSSSVLPGIGGIWDVTDSLLPSLPVAYAILISGWLGGMHTT